MTTKLQTSKRVKQQVLDYLVKSNGIGKTANDIADAYGKDVLKIRNALSTLIRDRRITSKKQESTREKIYSANGDFYPTVKKLAPKPKNQDVKAVAALSAYKTHGSLIDLPAAKGGLAPRNVNYIPSGRIFLTSSAANASYK